MRLPGGSSCTLSQELTKIVTILGRVKAERLGERRLRPERKTGALLCITTI